MEIWLIINGKRSGPYPDYEVRGRIEHGEMEPGEKIWHDGLEEWTPIGELELFRKSFEDRKPEEEQVEPPTLPQEYLEHIVKDTAKLKPKLYLGRRFWARWMDLTAYSALWWLAMYFSGRDIGSAIGNPWLLLTMYLPWFAIEAWMIQHFGRTPGKWLMGLRVVNEDGSKLALKAATWRSLRVMVTGIGFGWSFLSILCQAMSWVTTRRIGKPIWDHIGGHQVTVEPLSSFRTAGLVVFFFIAAQLQMAVRGPHEEEIMAEAFPQYKEYFERDGKWYFPVRK